MIWVGGDQIKGGGRGGLSGRLTDVSVEKHMQGRVGVSSSTGCVGQNRLYMMDSVSYGL